MKKLIMAALVVGGAIMAYQSALAQTGTFIANDLYLGFQNAAGSGSSDYIINLGPASGITNGSSVVTLSSDFSKTSFLTTLASSSNMLAGVVGGVQASSADVYLTQPRVGGAGTPSVPGSSVTVTISRTKIDSAVSALAQANLPPATGGNTNDAAKTWEVYVDPASPSASTFNGNASGYQDSTVATNAVLYMDLWYAANSASFGSTSFSYLGYFTLDLTGGSPVLNYTPSSATGSTPAPTAAFTSTVTNGFAPLTVVFTNTSTGSFTNSVWSFGNGTLITNTTAGNVTNIYAASGSYTVSLTVNGAGGSSTNTLTGYLTASLTPSLGGVIRSGGNLVFGGSNCPAGVQYRILSATNVATALTNWVPVWTNTFLGNGTFTYTNTSTTNSASFFRMISP
jgi:PKD repeat protein